MRRLMVFVPGDEEEAVRVFSHSFVVGEAEHDDLTAARIGALAYERQPLRGVEAVAPSEPLHPLICAAERGLIHSELAAARLALLSPCPAISPPRGVVEPALALERRSPRRGKLLGVAIATTLIRFS
jgi:hypothetical protein